ncbi:MAG: sialidase family protein [Gemmatimonadaceae bacterium]
MHSCRRLWLLVETLVLVAVSSAPGFAQTIRVVSDVAVDANPKGRAVTETHIAVDPRNPDHVLAAAMIGPPPGGTTNEQYCATFLTTDGAAHWTRHDFQMTGCYDPWVVFLSDGSALLSTLGHDRALAGDGDGMLVYRSVDGGITWGARPAGLSWGWDHPMTVVDRSGAKRGDWVYLVSSKDPKKDGNYVVAVSRSLDGGQSFDSPRLIAPEGKVIRAETPVVLSNGTLVVPYVEILDHGVVAPRRRSFVVHSTNGIDFSKPTSVDDVCGPPPTVILSSLAVDASHGPFRDRLYFACVLPNRAGVAVTHSANGGATWSRAMSAAGDPRIAGVSRSLMATAVSSDGVFTVAWLEHRVDSPPSCLDLYVSASFDGGDRFTRPTRVSTRSSCPNAKLNGPTVPYGDYFGMAPDSRGRIRVAWADARTGLFQLRTALLAFDPPPR